MQKDARFSMQVSEIEEDNNWREMFRVGTVTFAFLGIFFIVALASNALLGTIPSSSVNVGVAYISSHGSFYEIAYGSLFVAGLLLFPSIFSIFLALRHTSRAWAWIGFGTMAAGIPIFIASAAQALTLPLLANSYASSTGDLIQQNAVLGASLASLTSLTLLQKATYFIFAVGSIINGIVSLKSKSIGKIVGGLILAGCFFILIGIFFTAALAPAILFFACAFWGTAWKLYAITKRSEPL